MSQSQNQSTIYRPSIKRTKYKAKSKVLTDKLQNQKIARLQRQVNILNKSEIGQQTFGQNAANITTTPTIVQLITCPGRGDGDYEREGNVIVLRKLTVSILVVGCSLDTGLLVDRYNMFGIKIGFVKSPIGDGFAHLTAARCWDTTHSSVYTQAMADMYSDYKDTVRELAHEYGVVTGSSWGPAVGTGNDATKDHVWYKKLEYTFPSGIKMECKVPDSTTETGWITNLPYITYISDSGSSVHPTISWSSHAEYEM